MNAYLDVEGRELKEINPEPEPSIEYVIMYVVPNGPLQMVVTQKQCQLDPIQTSVTQQTSY